MRTLKLTIAYDGTRYAGWQLQRSNGRTIQGTLQQALHQILGERVGLVGSGRTDAGVHALGQVAHVTTSSRIPREQLQRALNSLLPSDVVVTRLEEAPPRFHARFSAKAKRYRYTIVNGPVVLPFERCYVHHVRVPLNVALMRREAKALRGRHDFRAFQRTGSSAKDARRTIHTLHIRRRGHRLEIDIAADGFVYAMARRIVGTLIEIGRGYYPPGTIARLLATGDRRLVGPTAPAKGLCLVQVLY